MAELELQYGLAFGDLYRRQGLAKVDDAFLRHLGDVDAALRDRLLAARAEPAALTAKDESALLIDLAPHLEDFIGRLFGLGGALELAARYAAWATLSPAGRAAHRTGVLFKQPHKLDMLNLVHLEKHEVAGAVVDRYPPERWRRRDGFKLTDAGTDLLGALDNANYCIWCHEQSKDSCSHGLKEKKTGAFQKSAFGVTLAGCPLEEKVSEMNMAKARGHAVGALAIAVVDNPMLAGTGHRICNDCMKACIY